MEHVTWRGLRRLRRVEGAPEDAVVEDIRALLDEMTAEGFLNIQ